MSDRPATTCPEQSTPAETAPVMLALDFGTTTLAGRLLTADGTVLVDKQRSNPQRQTGADILSRLQRAQEGQGVTLQTLLVEGVRSLIQELLDSAGLAHEAVVAVAGAGNPGICCLLLNMPASTLLFPPHKPPFKTLTKIPVTKVDLGLSPALDLFPQVTGFVGGDLLAVLLWVESLNSTCGAVESLNSTCGAVESLNSTCGAVESLNCAAHVEMLNSTCGAVESLNCAAHVEMLNQSSTLEVQRFNGSTLQQFNGSTLQQFNSSTLQQFIAPTVPPATLVIDIGTNAELALWDGLRWWVTSAAAGPAFEGGNIHCGMLLAEGAVTDVNLTEDRLQLTVAGGGHAAGLCGSGLTALVASSLEGGLVDVTGRILSPDEVETNLGRYLVRHDNAWAIRFYRSAGHELLLTQDDLRNFQLAKGAVCAGVQVLLERGGYAPHQVSRVLLTGALGNALPIEALKRVALLPEPMLDKISFVADGVLAGVQVYLSASAGEEKLAHLVRRVQPFPLSGTPLFEQNFLAALEFL